mgnify:FL=1
MDVLKAVRSQPDSGPQEQPHGWGIQGWHVDDTMGLACDHVGSMTPEENRVVQYLQGQIQTVYATTLCGWHGNKSLGFTIACDDEHRTVNLSAPDALSQAADRLLKGQVRFSPKHASTANIDDLAPGEVPPEGHPERTVVMQDMSETRSGLGVGIWLSAVYLQAMPTIHALCSNMASPSADTRKSLNHLFMHLLKYGTGVTYGGPGCENGLEQPDELIHPTDDGPVPAHYHLSLIHI